MTNLPPDATEFSILATGLSFPEGPAFDAAGNLWCVEMTAGMLWRRSVDGDVQRYRVGGRPNGLAIDQDGGIWFCDSGHDAIRRFDPFSETIATVADTILGRRLDRPNDLAFDGLGNLVFTCPGESRTEPTGYVCALAPDGDLSVIADGLYFPNGLAFTRDDAALVVAETRRNRLWSGRWDATMRIWSNLRILATTSGSIGPDGLALDAEGRIYVAVHGSTGIEVKTPEGRSAGAVSLGDGNPTNCAFDPTGGLGLVVTEAAQGSVLSFPGWGPGLVLNAPAWRAQDGRRGRPGPRSRGAG